MRHSLLNIFLLLAAGQAAMAQRADTAAIIREFNDVLAFAAQPYLHYTSVTSLHSDPMLHDTDTGNVLHGEFYKLNDDLYYGTGHEEMFLQDSLMIRINRQRKTIWISKVDVSTKKNMDLLPLKKADYRKLLRDRYAISKMPDRGDTGTIALRPQPGRITGLAAGKEMKMEYTKDHLPLLFQVTMETRQPQSPQVTAILTAKGFDVQHMEEDDNGVRALVMTQTATVRFLTIETTKEAAMQMRRWTERVDYDPVSGKYQGKGDYVDYRIIKTF